MSWSQLTCEKTQHLRLDCDWLRAVSMMPLQCVILNSTPQFAVTCDRFDSTDLRLYRGMFVMLWFILRSRSPDLPLNIASVLLAGSLFLQKPKGRLVPGSLGAAKEISRLS